MPSPLPNPKDKPEIIEREGGKYISLPSPIQAEQIVHKTRIKLADLPALPNVTTPMAAVISYEMMGLDIEEIAIATGLTVGNINTLKINPAYTEMRKMIVESIVDANKSEIKEKFVQARGRAADRVIELVDSPKGNVALSASKMVMEASGYKMSPEEKAMDPMRNGLTIVYVNSDDKEPPKDILDALPD